MNILRRLKTAKMWDLSVAILQKHWLICLGCWRLSLILKRRKSLQICFATWKKDLLLVTSNEERRRCVEITPDLYAAGITSCVDEWMEIDSNGEAEETRLNPGDFLIVNEAGNSVYCIRRDEFLETHSL